MAEVQVLEGEIIRGAIKAAMKEMTILMERTSMSPIIREKHDCFVGIYDRRARMVDARVIFTGPGMLDYILATYPPEGMEEGDVYCYNDPYASGGGVSHTPDMVFAMPVFVNKELIAYAAAFGHFADIGGMRPGSISALATEVFQEGLLVPAIRLIHAGRLNEEANRILLNNTRNPLFMEGDIRAMIASCDLGRRRLLEICGRFGAAKVTHTFNRIIEETGEKAHKLFLDAVPEGDYSFSEFLDTDDRNGRPLRIELAFHRRGDRIIADFAGTDAQSKGANNLILTPGVFRMMLGYYLMLLDPSLEVNEGLLRSVDVVDLPAGSLVNPAFPAALGNRGYTRSRANGCLLGVLAQANPGSTPADSAAYSLCTLRPSEESPLNFRPFTDALGVGWGGRPFADGTDVVYGIAQHNYPVEFVEKEYPFRIEYYGLHRDSGGPGKFRGGCGLRRDVRILAQRTLAGTRMENTEFPAWGVEGGRAGRPGRWIVNPGSAKERFLKPHGDDAVLEEGDLLRILTSGGGGWGDPLERDPQRVLKDVMRGFVSVEGAERDYGIVLSKGGGEVDKDATHELRIKMRKDGSKAGLFDRGNEPGESIPGRKIERS
jgi:N-methylhydantoinase B